MQLVEDIITGTNLMYACTAGGEYALFYSLVLPHSKSFEQVPYQSAHLLHHHKAIDCISCSSQRLCIYHLVFLLIPNGV